MSVIFGTRDEDGVTLTEEVMRVMGSATTAYGPDHTSVFSSGPIGMGVQTFRTHVRSKNEEGCCQNANGDVVTLDGRIDNFHELASQFGLDPTEVSDSRLLLRCFEEWGGDCFCRFIGEWACAIWSSRNRALYLARDHAGTRTLFFSQNHNAVVWSSYLETFFAGIGSLNIASEYLARMLSLGEFGELTPYQGVKAVPAAHYLVFEGGKMRAVAHWSSIAKQRLHYANDREYDERFLVLFSQAVKRRTDEGAEIIAELSGGVDSSSIVCMSDVLTSLGQGRRQKINTISYFDETEPDWNERPYFTAVERVRGVRGIHLDVSGSRTFQPLRLPGRRYPYLGADRSSHEQSQRFAQAVGQRNVRVIISGVGGDELLGGVPNPLPELADYCVHGLLLRLFLRSTEWCLVRRQPLVLMVRDISLYLCRLYRHVQDDAPLIPPWLNANLRQLAHHPEPRSGSLLSRLSTRPSALAAARTWKQLQASLPNQQPPISGCYEYRFPYLDRDLVDFLHAVPREQLLGPGRRRLLMRRALSGVVPAEVLERKRKAYLQRGLFAALHEQRTTIEGLFRSSRLAESGYIDPDRFLDHVDGALTGGEIWIPHIHRTITAELWLRSLDTEERRSPQKIRSKVWP